MTDKADYWIFLKEYSQVYISKQHAKITIIMKRSYSLFLSCQDTYTTKCYKKGKMCK